MKNELNYVERWVVEDNPADQSPYEENTSKPLVEFRSVERYVLLGEPGAGKTTVFKREADVENSCYIPAHEFIDLEDPEWQGKTLFIDGLDEVIANAGNRTPLNQIRSKLHQLNIQRYRISCRAADWHGERDQSVIELASGEIKVLQLQGLTEENIKTILQNDPRVTNADDFHQQAETNQLGNFLSNPQTLNMLIDATEGGLNWPTSKQELYQKACEVLSKEPNAEHAESPASKFISQTLLDAAGELYAYMLIANSQSFNTTEVDEKSFISLPKLGITKDQPHYAALKTRLFTPISNIIFNPIHRSVAEFLAAKYLTKKLEQGLSLRRCFALITGFDGQPVAALRGLYAWLGTLSIGARAKAIEADVLGLVQYGDVSGYSVADKLKVIEALKIQANKLEYLDYRDDIGFAGLVTDDMLPELKVILSTRDYAKPLQAIIIAILDGLKHSKPRYELKELVLEIVIDSKNTHEVRWRALDVFIQFDDTQALITLVDEIKSNKIEDNSDELMGQLLKRLFPDYIPASKIFDYLKTVIKTDRVSVYRLFWEYEFLELLIESDIPLLLDRLAQIEVKYFYYSHHGSLSKMVGGLVVRGLQLYGNKIDADRLYNWLGIGLDPETGDIYGYDNHESKQKIQMWLENNPEAFKKVLKVCLSKIESPEKFGLAFECLWDAKPPIDIGLWWLEQSLDSSNFLIKEQCFWKAYHIIKNEHGDKGLNEILKQWLNLHQEFNAIYEHLIEPSEYMKEHEARKLKWKDKHAAEVRQRVDYFYSHKTELLKGSAPPYALHHLASAYFDHYSDVNGKTGLERLEKFLDNNQELIDAAITGISKTLERTDLPAEQEVFELSVEGKIHYLQLPLLTAIEKRYNESSDYLSTLSDEIAQRALAYWLCYGAGNQPAWVKSLMLQRPELASQVLIDYITFMLQKKVAHIHGYYQLAHDEDLADIAKRVVMPVLTKFPTKSLANHGYLLESLLKVAIQYKGRDELLKLISSKLKRSSLDILQKVYLLATGLVIAPEQYETKVLKEMTSPERINHLSGFLYEGWHSSYKPLSLKPSTIELLISLIAPLASPEWPQQGGFVTKSMHDGNFVQTLINKLSNMTEKEVAQFFDRLLEKNELSRWFLILKNAQQRYLVNRREAEYQHPTPIALAQAINKTRPASVADLAAMVLDFLDKLQMEMHTTAFNEYKNYWNDDSYSRLTTPKVENTCARYLARQLKDRFSEFDIEVNSESLAPDDKRTDIRLIYHQNGSRLNLPIEIKRNFHEELWTAIHKQLIKLYTIEPDTQGRGIYLVLWFGDKFNKAPPLDGGSNPKTAAELRARLIATMSPEQQKLIDVFVLGVSDQR